MKYDNEAILEMCSKVDLLEYASQTIDLKKRGQIYVAHCPKHIDKTPSLTISPRKNLFYCFSCKRGGNITNWLMEFEHMSFVDAVNKTAKLAGVDINSFKTADALAYYKKIKVLNSQPDRLAEREVLDHSVLDQYELTPPEEWLQEGILPEIMERYNIRIDRKANRIIYPVYDRDFNLIGIKGRTRYENYKDLDLQKYQNYHKIGTTNFFCGMFENEQNIKNKDEVIIFEGIKSGMKVEAWGYNNWVASETSHLNSDQIKILVKLGIKDVVIAFDNDVDKKQIIESTRLLRRFVNVFHINDKHQLLGDKTLKLSPPDKGREVWEQLYRERVRIN